MSNKYPGDQVAKGMLKILLSVILVMVFVLSISVGIAIGKQTASKPKEAEISFEICPFCDQRVPGSQTWGLHPQTK